jgi:prepilin-type N-terminal cleavage/methylation domain-containing protein
MQKLKGFTLIEVLVTIAIIAILASIIFASFGDARDSSRNKAMIIELKEVQLALGTYRAQNDSFPLPADGACRNTDAGAIYASDSGCTGLYIDGLVPEFISELPLSTGSANENCDIEYRTANDGTWYKLTAINCLEGVDITTGVGPEEPLARCAISCSQSSAPCDPTSSDYYQSFAVYSLGGQCE